MISCLAPLGHLCCWCFWYMDKGKLRHWVYISFRLSTNPTFAASRLTNIPHGGNNIMSRPAVPRASDISPGGVHCAVRQSQASLFLRSHCFLRHEFRPATCNHHLGTSHSAKCTGLSVLWGRMLLCLPQRCSLYATHLLAHSLMSTPPPPRPCFKPRPPRPPKPLSNPCYLFTTTTHHQNPTRYAPLLYCLGRSTVVT